MYMYIAQLLLGNHAYLPADAILLISQTGLAGVDSELENNCAAAVAVWPGVLLHAAAFCCLTPFRTVHCQIFIMLTDTGVSPN